MTRYHKQSAPTPGCETWEPGRLEPEGRTYSPQQLYPSSLVRFHCEKFHLWSVLSERTECPKWHGVRTAPACPQEQNGNLEHS